MDNLNRSDLLDSAVNGGTIRTSHYFASSSVDGFSDPETSEILKSRGAETTKVESTIRFAKQNASTRLEGARMHVRIDTKENVKG